MSRQGNIVKYRDRYRVWIPWKQAKSGKLWFQKYTDGTPLFAREQAERVWDILNGELDAGTFDPALHGKDRPLIFKNAWQTYCEEVPVKPATERNREHIYRRYLSEYWGEKCLKEIEEPHVSAWFAALPDHLSPSYRSLIKVTLKAFFNHWTITRRKMLRFPTVRIPRQKAPWLTREEQDRVLEQVNRHQRPIMEFIRAYGCRPIEACNLKNSDVDWKRRVITFRNRKNAEENELPFFEGIEEILAGGGCLPNERSGEIPDRSVVKLSPSAKIINLTYAFSTIHGHQYKRGTLTEEWHRASIKANRKHGVKIVPLKNGTRHSFASQKRNEGVSLEMIARVLGNSQAVVERNYGRITTNRVSEVLEFRKVEGT